MALCVYCMLRTDSTDPFNQLEQPEQLSPPKAKLISKLLVYALIIFGIIGVTFSYGVISSGEHLSQSFGKLSLLEQFRGLVGSGDRKLRGEQDGRVNILLIGVGGGDHDGPNLADTLLLVSLKPEDDRVAMISIPRDLLVPIPGYGWRKINNANAFGEAKNPGHGAALAVDVVSQVLNVPIHYYARIDFTGFTKLVDDLRGITVDVENTLEDFHYPVKGMENATIPERYEHLLVPEGKQRMDGELALKYVRSRQAIGVEGSDFSRSRRQQRVLLAIKDKMLNLGTLLNPVRISNVMGTLSEHFTTDMELWEILRLSKLGRDLQEQDIIRWVFDDSPDNLLTSTVTEDGAFVLVPKGGGFGEMQVIASGIFDPALPEKQRDQRIEIQNGTKISGLAYQVSQYLQSRGYQVITIGNAPTQDYQKTVVYDLQHTGVLSKTEGLVELLGAQLASSLPDWMTATTAKAISPNADVVIILGQDRKNQ